VVEAGTGFRVALTFDAEHPDRPHRPGVTEEILDVLADRAVSATWFLQGRWVEAFPATARRVASDGHLVGNHSFYHARLPLLTDAGMACFAGEGLLSTTVIRTGARVLCSRALTTNRSVSAGVR